MLTAALFFVLAFATLVALVWSSIQLFRSQDDPLGDRLDELQANLPVTSRGRNSRRRGGGGFLNTFLYVVSLVPGADDWIRDTEKELNQAGVRNRGAVGLYILGQVIFMALMLGGMAWLQRENGWPQKFGGMISAFLLGWLLPQQVLHRLVKRYRRRLQDALPDTVDLLGIVLGTGLALDQAL